MKITFVITALFTVLLLQACESQSTRADADIQDNQPQQLSNAMLSDDNNNNLATKNNARIKPEEDEVITTPETQIIRELFQAGCLIEDFELDRRKQNMRISCAKEFVPINSSI